MRKKDRGEICREKLDWIPSSTSIFYFWGLLASLTLDSTKKNSVLFPFCLSSQNQLLSHVRIIEWMHERKLPGGKDYLIMEFYAFLLPLLSFRWRDIFNFSKSFIYFFVLWLLVLWLLWPLSISKLCFPPNVLRVQLLHLDL